MKDARNRFTPLHRYEIFCYTVIWAMGVIYTSYSVFDISSSKFHLCSVFFIYSNFNFFSFFNRFKNFGPTGFDTRMVVARTDEGYLPRMENVDQIYHTFFRSMDDFTFVSIIIDTTLFYKGFIFFLLRTLF